MMYRDDVGIGQSEQPGFYIVTHLSAVLSYRTYVYFYKFYICEVAMQTNGRSLGAMIMT